jgi:hypothetical protein
MLTVANCVERPITLHVFHNNDTRNGGWDKSLPPSRNGGWEIFSEGALGPSWQISRTAAGEEPPSCAGSSRQMTMYSKRLAPGGCVTLPATSTDWTIMGMVATEDLRHPHAQVLGGVAEVREPSPPSERQADAPHHAVRRKFAAVRAFRLSHRAAQPVGTGVV